MRFFSNRQDDTTNSQVPNTRIESGWGVMTPGAATNANETVTFQTPFTNKPIVVITYGGDALSATTYGSGANSIKLFAAAKATNITTTNFIAWCFATDATLYAAGNTVFYQWIAIGL